LETGQGPQVNLKAICILNVYHKTLQKKLKMKYERKSFTTTPTILQLGLEPYYCYRIEYTAEKNVMTMRIVITSSWLEKV
jgi:hypothetical protein